MERPRSTRAPRGTGRLAALAAALGTVLASGAVVHSGAPAAAADASTKYLGIFREAAPTQIAAGTVNTYGVAPASVVWFDSWGSGRSFPVSEARSLWARGVLPHFTWEPWNTALGVSDPGQIHLADIVNGSWDSYIRARAAEFAAVGSPMLLRFGHEFNGDWYPWAVANNGNNPALFVTAYRRVHDLVRAAGATNVQWIWAFNNDSSPAASWNDPAQAYPGSAYVDWVGIDGYNWGFGPSWDPAGNHWRSFSSLYTNAYQRARSIAPNRPVAITEIASSEDGGDKAAWIGTMSSELRSGRFPDLKLVTWFDQDKEERWSGTSSPAARTAFTSWVAQPYMNGTGPELAQVAGQYAGTPTATPTSTPPTGTPTTSAPASTTTPSPGGSAGCTATFRVANSWSGGFVGAVTVASGTSAIAQWRVTLSLPAGTTVTNVWNGTLVGASSVTNVSWNGSIPAGRTVEFGFQASGSGPAGATVTGCTTAAT